MRNRVVIFITTVMLVGIIPVRAQVNADQVTTIGKNVLAMEDYMLAVQYFNQAIKAKPYLADPYFYRALAKLSLDDYQGAVDDCTLAIERNKFKTEAYKLRGFARQNLGLDSLAIADYNIGLQYNPVDKYFLFYKAVAQTSSKDYDNAEATFADLLRNYPSFEDGYAARASLRLERQDTVAALADIDKSLQLSRNLVNPYLMRAAIRADRGEWDEAMQDMDDAIRLKPREPSLYVNRAFVRYNSDDFFGAMADYNYAVELDNDYLPAIFNRALLETEVRDLESAAADFSRAIEIEPRNYHAIFNRGLVYLDLGKYDQAERDFQEIARRFPKYNTVYYALAQLYRDKGNMRRALMYANRADEMVRNYVHNPEANPLERPTIASGYANNRGAAAGEGESDQEVMDRFNRLVTVQASPQNELSYNEKIKGRVQDRNVAVEAEPPFYISILDTPQSLQTGSNYFREIDDLNQARYIGRTLSLTNSAASPDASQAADLFRLADDYTAVISNGKARPVDRLARGIVYTQLKNYEGALEDIDAYIDANRDFASGYMVRAYVETALAHQPSDNESAEMRTSRLHDAIRDYDAALKIAPRLVYAIYNKGCIYYGLHDYTSALQCFSDAVKLAPNFGQAWFNRGLVYLAMGNKQQAFADLSKAGELGIIPSYNVLKRMK